MSAARAVRFERAGGPHVLEIVEQARATPGANEIAIRQTAIGVNFIDTYHRSGLYPLPLPSGVGLEAVGVVEQAGDGVHQVSEGQRVGYCWGPVGAYASHRIMNVDMVVPLPDDIDDATAAAAMLKGLTAEYLIERCGRVEAGWTVLLHAAAGGVGLIAAQWLKAIGATVIGTAGSEAKAELAREHGCEHVILYDREDVAERVRAITGGAGVPVVIDGVGASTFDGSLASLARRGLMISYGNASGLVPPLDIARLTRGGSTFITRPTLFDYCSTATERAAAAARLFQLIASGAIRIRVDQRFALADAARAHTELEARRTTGSTILLP